VKARTSLEIAERLHKESINNFEADRPAIAAQLAGRAREAILQTIALAKKEAKLEEGAIKAIDRARARLEQARQLLQENRDRQAGQARKFAEEAHAQLLRAHDNMREHLFEIALRLAISSEELSQRAIDILKRDFIAPEFVEREIEKTDEVIEGGFNRCLDHIADADGSLKTRQPAIKAEMVIPGSGHSTCSRQDAHTGDCRNDIAHLPFLPTQVSRS